MLIAPKNLTVFDLWGMAMCMALGGVFAGWNIGLTAGFGSYVCATALVASGYVALVCSLAEVASALPFAGGSYGIARVTLGVFPGYMIACYDSVESIIYTATAVLAVGAQLGTAADTPYYVEIVFWFLSYGSVLALHMFGGHVMWRVALVLAVISILTLLMFVFGKFLFC